QLDLVHMNGRIYDPLIGRFLSADPILQDPMNGQSYNRYSYVMNNPTNLTDPTGFSAEGIEGCSVNNGGCLQQAISQAELARFAKSFSESQQKPPANSKPNDSQGNKPTNPKDGGAAKNDAAGSGPQANNSGLGAAPGEKLSSALTHARLSNGMYDKSFTGADGYTMLPGTLVDDEKTGLRTAVFGNGTNYIQAFAGTSPTSSANWSANLAQAFGFESPQYKQGMDSARANYIAYDGNISFTGHSLGGGIAAASAIVTGGRAVTFNAAGVHDNTIGNSLRSNGSVTSYYSSFDVLRVLNWITPSSASVPGQRISLGAAGFHGMGSMLNALGGKP
ncbi:MAG: RHS repeat-associated core domain-containing protein, partial [Burkholderiales bacterium]